MLINFLFRCDFKRVYNDSAEFVTWLQCHRRSEQIRIDSSWCVVCFLCIWILRRVAIPAIFCQHHCSSLIHFRRVRTDSATKHTCAGNLRGPAVSDGSAWCSCLLLSLGYYVKCHDATSHSSHSVCWHVIRSHSGNTYVQYCMHTLYVVLE